MPETTDPLTSQAVHDLSAVLCPLIVDLRMRRKPINERWLLYHAAYAGRHTRTFFNSEMFKHFIPAARRAVERFVIRATQMVVPSIDFFEVYPADEYDTQNPNAGKEADSVRSYMSYLLRKRIKVYGTVRQLFRSWALYGRAIAKTGVEVINAQVKRRDGTVEPVNQTWPTMRVVDPFYFYAYPETVTDPARLQVMVEDIMLPWDTYAQMMRAGIVKTVDQANLSDPEWPDHQVRRLQGQNLSDPSTVNTGGEQEGRNALVGFVAISEVWLRKEGAWQRVWVAWNVRGLDEGQIVRYNPKPYPLPPYRMATSRDLPSEHYGTGMMDDLEPMQVLLNDQVNMTLEGQATNFSPPTVVDPHRVYRSSSLTFRPRAKWLADPEGIKFFEPRDITKFGLQGVQFTLGLIDSFSGSNPLAEGQPTRGLPRAGFAVSSLLNLSLADMKDAAQMMEDQILTPLLGDLFRLTVEYADPKQIIKIPGTQDWPARKFSVSDMVGDWDFQWVGSIQAQDMQVKAQRMVAFMGMLFKTLDVVTADLASKNKKLNIEALLKRVWRDSLGERGVDRIVEEMTPEEVQARQQMAEMQMALQLQGGKPGPGSGGHTGSGPGPAYPASPEAATRQTGRQLLESPVAGPGG